MKKTVIRKLIPLLTVLTLLVGVSSTAFAYTQDYWKALNAFTAAKESGDNEAALQAANNFIAYLDTQPLDTGIGINYYNTYFWIYQSRVYENKGDYDSAIKNTERLRDISEYLTENGVDRNDMVTITTAYLRKLDPCTEVYALTSSPVNYPAYSGAKYVPSMGTYIGRVVNGNAQDGSNANAILENEAAVSIYVSLGAGESAATYEWKIKKFDDGEHIIHVALNYNDEAVTAQDIVDGKLDSDIDDTLNCLSKISSPVIMRIGAEMNCWSNEVEPELYKKSFIYIATRARSIAPNVALSFSPNWVSGFYMNMEDFYPGDEYVDWVGVSLYMNGYANTDNVAMGQGIYNSTILNVQEVVEKFGDTKPIYVSEGGALNTTTEHTSEVINEMYNVLNMVYPQIKMIIYFDTTVGSSAYTLSDNPALISEYNTAISANSSLITRSTQNAQAVYMPLSDYTDSRETIDLASYSRTIYGDGMTVKYTLDGNTLQSAATVPYRTSINASSLSYGKHTLTVSFDDGAGYTAEKTYSLTKQLDGTVTTGTPTAEQPSSWAAPEVAEAISDELIPASFQKNYTDDITRRDFCELAVKLIEAKSGMEISEFLASKNVSTKPGAFPDTTDEYVLAIAALGIVNGRSDGTFDPDAGIQRQEAAKILVETARVLGITSTNSTPLTFTDESDIQDWAVEYVSFISALSYNSNGGKVMGGNADGTFDPRGGYTRQQTYVTMLRLYKVQA